MTELGSGNPLWIIGAGRLGLALGLVLHRRGFVSTLVYSGRSAHPPEHPLFGEEPLARYLPGLALPSPPPGAVLIAVPDQAVARVAERLSLLGLPAGTPVLHLSGALGTDVLQPLRAAGCPVGSLHPLAAVADAVAGAERLVGAWFGIEAEGAAHALAERIVRACDGSPLAIEPGGKALYHAAAVFASNYLVVLLGLGERLMARAGVPTEAARHALGDLARGAAENVAAQGAAGALTGPLTRGDAETVLRHLRELFPEERSIYSRLGHEALALIPEGDLDPADRRRLHEILGEHA